MNRTTTLHSPVRFQNGVSWVPVSECLSTDSSDMQELISSRPKYIFTNTKVKKMLGFQPSI